MLTCSCDVKFVFKAVVLYFKRTVIILFLTQESQDYISLCGRKQFGAFF